MQVYKEMDIGTAKISLEEMEGIRHYMLDVISPEERYKCGNAFRGIKRPDHSKRMKGEGNPMYGKNEQAYGIINRAKENSGKTYEEIFGVEKAKIIKETMSKNRKGKPHNLIEKICPHCGLKGRGPNMTRYHFDKCKALK